MEYTPEDLIDKMTIIRLKLEESDSPELKKEYAEYEEAIADFESRGLKMERNWIEELYKSNKEQWDVMVEISNVKEKTNDLIEIGKLFIKAEELNKERNAIKKKIVDETKIGFKEIEMN